MGKKDKIHHHPKFEELYNKFIKMSEEEIQTLWNKYGQKSLTYYNFRWYWSFIEEWACIDNSHGERNFQILIPLSDFQDDKKNAHWERLAVVIASELRLRKDSI